MNDKAKEISFHPLKDVPGDKDEFGGGGHKRSASALAAAIQEFSEDDRSVGLEGTWGSGKSTVVDIAAARLEEEAPGKFQFFTYDLWANQTTEFRRTFLEEFVAWISDKGILNKSEVKKFRDEIRDRKKTIKTDSYHRFSFFGVILILSLPFIPFLALWLSPFAANFHYQLTSHNNTPEDTAEKLPWIFDKLEQWGAILALSLIVVLIISFIIQFLYHCFKSKGFIDALNRSLSVFSKKSDVDFITQNIRDEDPTQYEFRTVFEKILLKVQGDGKRVVFVFDNIDRIPSSKIPDLWSEVRSVFSSKLMDKRSKNHKVTAVVPYDKNHILSAFETDIDSVPPSESALATTLGDREAFPEDISKYVQEDIFRKSFSAVVSVAAPVTTDVETFFNKKLKEALLDQFGDGHRYRLFQIFDAFLGQLQRPATPRQIKSFINEIGSLWAQWEGRISIESIAIFTLYRSKLEKNPKLIQKPETIPDRLRHYANADNLDSELAALAYNVDPGLALQVLLARDFEQAFRSDTPERLQELVEAHPSAFTTQIDGILLRYTNIWAGEGARTYIRALGNYIAADIPASVKVLSDRHFRSALSNLGGGRGINLDELAGLSKIVECTPLFALGQITDVFADWVVQTCTPRNSDPGMKDGRAWIKLVGSYLNAIKDRFGEEEKLMQSARIELPVFDEFRCGIALDCDEVNLHYRNFKRSDKRSVELAQLMEKYVVDGESNFSYIWPEIAQDLPKEAAGTILDIAVAEARSERLDKEEDQRENIFLNIELLWAAINGTKGAVGKIDDLVNSGVIFWHFDQARELNDNHTQAVALWLTSYVLGKNNLPGLPAEPPQPFGDLNSSVQQFSDAYQGEIEDALLNEIVQLVLKRDGTDRWIKLACEEADNRLLYKKTLDQMAKSEDFIPPSLPQFLSYRTKLKEIMKDGGFELFGKVGDAVTKADIDSLAQDQLTHQLVQNVQSRREPGWIALVERVDKMLTSLDSDGWREAIAERNENYNLLMTRGKALSGKVPPQNLKEPILENIYWILQLGQDDAFKPVDQDTLFDALKSPTRKKLPADLFEGLGNKETTPRGVREAVASYPAVVEELPVDSNPTVALRKILFPMMSIDSDQCLSMIGANESRWRKAVKKADDDVKGELDGYLESLVGPEGEDETDSYENRIRAALGLPRRVRKKEEPDDTSASEEGAGSDESGEPDPKKK